MSGSCIVRDYPYLHIIDRFCNPSEAADRAYQSDMLWWADHCKTDDCVSIWQPGVEAFIGFRVRPLDPEEASRYKLINPEPALRVAFLGYFRIRSFALRLCGEEPTPVGQVESRYRWQFRNLLYAELSVISRQVLSDYKLWRTCGGSLALKWQSMLDTPPVRFDYEGIKTEDDWLDGDEEDAR